MAQTIINVTDTAFLGRVSEVALGASAIGGLLYLAIIMLGFGVGVGAQIIIARRFGEGKEKQIGETFEHALLILLIMSFFSFFLIRFLSGDFLVNFLKSETILSETRAFLSYRAWGVFFAFTSFAFRAFYIGVTNTRIITWTTVIMALVNTILNYLLIFGKMGFPKMGIEGAAIASVIAEISAIIFFVLFTFRAVDLERFRIFKFTNVRLNLILRILRLSSPIVLQHFVAFTAWFFFFLFVENMGQTPLAISNIVRSVYLIMMLPIWGFSSAANTLVSYLIGRGQTEEVLPLVAKISKLSFAFVAILVIFSMIFPELILSVYTNSPDLIAGAIPVLYVISVAAMFFSVAFILFNAVMGTGNTKIAFAIELGSLIIYFLVLYIITHSLQSTIEVAWIIEVIYAVLIGSLSFLYLKLSNWRGAKV